MTLRILSRKSAPTAPSLKARATPPPPRGPKTGGDVFEKSKPRPVELVGARRCPTRESAIAAARALLEGPAKDTATDQNAVVTSDPTDVNSSQDTRDSKRSREAQQQLVDNEALESAALRGLSASEQAQYAAVKQATADAGDPVATLALQTMLLEGTLPGPKATDGETTVLGGLAGLTTAPLGAGVDRGALICDLVQEVAVPAAIAQEGKGTCAATAVGVLLLRSNPAEYVRLVAGLASESGEVTTAGGDVLRVEEGALTDTSGRSVPQRLLAPALMEVGNGRADYSNEADEHQGEDVSNTSGLTAAQVDVVLESVFGHDFAFHSVSSDAEKQLGAEFVIAEVEAGRATLVGLDWGTGGHKVLVTGTVERDGEKFVQFINPWGRTEEMPAAEFEARLHNVNYDPAGALRDLLERVWPFKPQG